MKELLSKTEQAIIQMLFAYGIIEDKQLKTYINKISKDLKENEIKFNESSTSSSSSTIHPLLLSLFNKINKSISIYSLQIKTVAYNDQITNEDGSKTNNFIFHHGIINIDEDIFAKKFGTILDEKLTKFFTRIAIRMVESKHLSTSDVYALKEDIKLTNAQIDDFLFSLLEQKWLGRDDTTAYWKLGYRSYLELKGYLQDATESTGPQTLTLHTVMTHG